MTPQITPVTTPLLSDLRTIIEQARQHVASTANYQLTMMYWHIGERINRELLGNERAAYGKQIVATLARQLQAEYGSKGFDEKNIRRMMQFARQFPDRYRNRSKWPGRNGFSQMKRKRKNKSR